MPTVRTVGFFLGHGLRLEPGGAMKRHIGLSGAALCIFCRYEWVTLQVRALLDATALASVGCIPASTYQQC
jgi:hypothetical protein